MILVAMITACYHYCCFIVIVVALVLFFCAQCFAVDISIILSPALKAVTKTGRERMKQCTVARRRTRAYWGTGRHLRAISLGYGKGTEPIDKF